MAGITSVRYHYIKSNAYRVVHVDGVYGGPTPNRQVYVSFFSERFPIPTAVEHAVKDLGENRFELGEEIASKRESREGVVREIEVGAVMTLGMAKKLHAWLGQTIEEIEKQGQGSDTGGTDAR